jgi:hypothetical protein
VTIPLVQLWGGCGVGVTHRMTQQVSSPSTVRFLIKVRARRNCTVAQFCAAFGACIGSTAVPGHLKTELWYTSNGDFIDSSEWASLECLQRSVEAVRTQWDEAMLALCAVLDYRFLAIWVGVGADTPSDFGWNSKTLLRIPAELSTYIEIYPDRDCRRLSSSAGFYYNNPYSLASWTCQVPANQVALPTLIYSPTTAVCRAFAARVVLEGGEERLAHALRAVAPQLRVGSLLIVRLSEGTTRLGRCVYISRWAPHRDARQRQAPIDRVLRHVNYSDLLHFQTNVVPLNEKAYMVAARYLHGQRPRTVKLESAEVAFDLSGIVLRCRWIGAPSAFWGDEALVATVRSELGFELMKITISGLTL